MKLSTESLRPVSPEPRVTPVQDEDIDFFDIPPMRDFSRALSLEQYLGLRRQKRSEDRNAMEQQPTLQPTIAQRWHSKWIAGQPVDIEEKITLRPKYSLRMTLHTR